MYFGMYYYMLHIYTAIYSTTLQNITNAKGNATDQGLIVMCNFIHNVFGLHVLERVCMQYMT